MSVCFVTELCYASREAPAHGGASHSWSMNPAGASRICAGLGPLASLRGPAPATRGGDPPPHGESGTSIQMGRVLPKGMDSEARGRRQLCGDRKVTRGSCTALGRPCHRAGCGASTSPVALTTLRGPSQQTEAQRGE